MNKRESRARWRSKRRCLVKMLCHRPKLRTAWPHSGTARTPNTTWQKALSLERVDVLPGGSGGHGRSADLAGAVGVRQGLGPIGEKQVRSPESISYETHAHCLLGSLDVGDAESYRCWGELVDILEGCSRTPREVLQAELAEPGSASLQARQARARLRFGAALAEWVNMHDLHKPYALGPPAKDQPCAHVDDEHSTMERVSCKKLYPRKLVRPGE